MPLHWLKIPRRFPIGGASHLARLLILGTLAASVRAEDPKSEALEPLAPGYQPLPFKAPEPGGFVLSDLGPAADALLIESTGSKVKLHALIRDKITVISFIYASCSEVNGCPLATSVLHRTQTALKQHPELKGKVRFLTISFDPRHDTPKVMAHYAQSFIQAGSDWHFLTAPSEEAATALLKAYQQSITVEPPVKGESLGAISHVLRVILVDPKFKIRNIYTPSVLHPDLLMADIRTLSISDGSDPTFSTSSAARLLGSRLHSGDDKSHYDRRDYQTRSASLTERKGAAQDLIRLVSASSLGLPKDPYDLESPLIEAKVALGRKLFYDRRLSLNQTISCAMCHIPEQGFTSQEQSTAIGIEGRTVRRNAPSILNTGRLHRLFHDGRESRLENQVWGPFLAPNEMGNPSVGQVIEKIEMASDYAGLFKQAFGKGPTMETIGEALAQYERTLIAGNSPFDQWHYGDKKTTLNEEAMRGYAIFTGKARCNLCHNLNKHDALFTDESFHNTGLGYQDEMGVEAKRTRVQIAPGIWTELDADTIQRVSEKKPSDLGRYEVTQNPDDRWKYRTPGLRNVALTAPYMHNGSLKTLEEVIAFYQRGGIPNPGLDPLIRPFKLSSREVKDLLAFLGSLTGADLDMLVEDAWSVPIGDPQSAPASPHHTD